MVQHDEHGRDEQCAPHGVGQRLLAAVQLVPCDEGERRADDEEVERVDLGYEHVFKDFTCGGFIYLCAEVGLTTELCF